METMGKREAVKLPKQVDARVLLTRTQLVFYLKTLGLEFCRKYLRVLCQILKVYFFFSRDSLHRRLMQSIQGKSDGEDWGQEKKHQKTYL